MAAGNEAAHGTYKGSISLGSCTGWKDWILELSAGGVSNLNTTEVIVPTCSDFEDREYQDVYEGTWSWSGESGTPLTLVLKNQETGNVTEVVTPAFSVGEPIKVEQSGEYAAAAVTRLENPLVPPEKQAAVDALIKQAAVIGEQCKIIHADHTWTTDDDLAKALGVFGTPEWVPGKFPCNGDSGIVRARIAEWSGAGGHGTAAVAVYVPARGQVYMIGEPGLLYEKPEKQNVKH